MKTKTTILATALVLSFATNLYQYCQLKNTKLELSIADESQNTCDEEVKNQEHKLGITYQLINE
jgi:hypothetical protein